MLRLLAAAVDPRAADLDELTAHLAKLAGAKKLN